MNQVEFIKEIKVLLSDFTFDVTNIGTIHGIKKEAERLFREGNSKDLVRILGERKIFISGQMYPNTERDFIYCIIHTTAKRRGYRCKNWICDEYNKIFTSGKTYVELLGNLSILVNKING